MTEELPRPDPATARIQNAAHRYVDNGWSVIPLNPITRTPLIRWREFQTRRPEPEEIDEWFRLWPELNLAVVTGAISGIVVVDADNQDAIDYCEAKGLTSPFCVRTRRGRHYYFRHPGPGVRHPCKVGLFNVAKLDFRGDGGFAVLPPSVSRKEGREDVEYAWEPCAIDWEDCPVWSGKPSIQDVTHADPDTFSFDQLDLSMVSINRTQLPAAEQARQKIEALGRLLMDGDGRNVLLRDYASEQIMKGFFGADLRKRCASFMDEFFADRLPPDEVEATIASMEAAERRNHPERFAPDGTYIFGKEEKPEEKRGFVPLYASDAEKIQLSLARQGFLIDPWLQPGSIIEIFGYSGHGKSLITQTCLWHLAMGRSIGPFDISEPAKIMYFDFENPGSIVADRLLKFRKSFGDPGHNFGLWASSVVLPENGGDINLQTEAGLATFQQWLMETKPDVVVIDTVRSAWPGLVENAAEEWGRVNTVLSAIRRTGASVVFLHHSNKPGDGVLGREAGSTAQLTLIDQQIRITQIYAEEDVAREKGGLFDLEAWRLLEGKCPRSHFLRTAIRFSYGKLRNVTDNHRPASLGLAEGEDGSLTLVSTASPRQIAVGMVRDGVDPSVVARRMMIPAQRIREWMA